MTVYPMFWHHKKITTTSFSEWNCCEVCWSLSLKNSIEKTLSMQIFFWLGFKQKKNKQKERQVNEWNFSIFFSFARKKYNRQQQRERWNVVLSSVFFFLSSFWCLFYCSSMYFSYTIHLWHTEKTLARRWPMRCLNSTNINFQF